ncbi:Crp/Fnr family transcriptional regulator [Ramlibacter tataouinensis]|uniref:Crp/Fnr family transcriptional regulator n=1 Tax=Ramlibacter tataouinensis TaxID=94132 RepID=UPI000776DBCD|nr:Crp/Fnr family transcriptional regulator [Ramlibacter tataouinensis]
MSITSIDRLVAARFLQQQSWFTHLSVEAQDKALRTMRTLRARKGNVVIPANEPADGWYAVLWGLVELQSAGGGSRTSYLALSGGEWFGEGSVLQSAPRRYEVRALRDSELLCLPRGLFHELLATSIPFNRAVLQRMNQRVAQAMAVIDSDRRRSPEQRLAIYLSRHFWPGLRKLNLSQDELAALAGMSRQTANRTLRALHEKGLITLRHGRVESLDQQALECFAGVAPPHWLEAPALDAA